MELDFLKEKSAKAIAAAKRSLDAISDSNAVKESIETGKKYYEKGCDLTSDAMDSEFAQSAKQQGRKIGEAALGGAHRTGSLVKDKWKDYTAETNATNWYERAAEACEQNVDAIQGTQDGVSGKLSRALAAKLGLASTSAGIFSLASLVGTASTGTAISSLSGAAFTNASLAWLGGSVVAGTAVLGVASIAGGIGAALGLTWLGTKYVYGDARKPEELSAEERKAVDACMALAIAFRERAATGKEVDAVSARYLHGEALLPLTALLADIQSVTRAPRPQPALKRCERATKKLAALAAYLQNFSKRYPNATTGVLSIVFLRLLADDLDGFTDQEQMVLTAIRRSKGELAGASDQELASYVQSLDAEQLQGVQNNVKGIYHEIRFVEAENTDGDQYTAELFEATNHPGADVRIINLDTGEVREVQLKSTQYMQSIKEHNERYESIDVLATSEVADDMPDVYSSGFTNAEMSSDVQGVSDQLGHYYDPGVLDSMAVAGTVALARNIGVLLKDGDTSADERQKLLKDGALSAAVAGLFSMVLS